MADIRGKTASGFEFTIEESALDDWEVLEAIVDISSGHYSAAVRVLKLLLGEEQTALLKKHCRNMKTGRVPKNAMFRELSDILSLSGSDRNDRSKNV